MVTTHREVFSELPKRRPEDLVIIETAYGFQSNADELTQRLREYFRDSTGVETSVARLRSLSETPAERAAALATARNAHWLFAGPGSPTYANRVWQETEMRDVVLGVLQRGSAVFASAAAMAMGACTMPVYEMYKVGADAHWHSGLDVLGAVTGIRAAIIAHYDNTDGGTHDTRYCFIGAERFAALEQLLDDDIGVLGLDEHTGISFDLDDETATVIGRGNVTLRAPNGEQLVLAAGTQVDTAELAAFMGSTREAPVVGTAGSEDGQQAFADLLSERNFTAAAEYVAAAVGDPELSRLVRALGSALTAADRDSEFAERAIGLLIALRAQARDAKQWALADSVRDGLTELGITLADSATGTTWTRTSD